MLTQENKPMEPAGGVAFAAPGHETPFAPPAGFEFASERKVSADGIPATLVRHIRRDRRNAHHGGERFSVVTSENGALLGVARMDLDLSGGPLPSRERAAAVALAFLEAWAPDLPPVMDVKWIEPHDEIILSAEGQRTLTGMKVKCFNTADGRWFWVIVGTGDEVIAFERDIVWLMDEGRRQTEKWLHDSWVAEQDARRA